MTTVITRCRHQFVQQTVLAWDIFRFPSGPHDGKTLRVQGHQGRALGRDGIVDVTVAIRDNQPEKVTITGSAVILFHAEWAIDF